MLRLTLRNIWAYKTRLGLSMLSIILGVAFLAGTLVFSATLRTTFNDLFATVYASTDAVLRSSEAQSSSDGFSQERKNLPTQLLDEVQDIDGVESAAGNIEIPNLVVIGEDGKKLFSAQGPPTLGFGATATEEVNLFRLVGPDGENLSNAETVNVELADNEVLVDKASADIKRLEVGDSVKVVRPNDVKEYQIKGVIRFGTADTIGGAAIFVFNKQQAFEIANKGETFAAIEFAAQEGVSQQELQSNIQAFLNENNIENVEVLTGEEAIEELQNETGQFIDIFGYILTGFAVVSFLVALIIIINSFAIVVAQRKKEYALLRAIGATGSQIRRSVSLEAAITGFVASVVGVISGIFLAQGIIGLLKAFEVSLPVGDLVVPPTAVVFGLVVGTLASVGSAFIPAFTASRIAPIEALRDSAFEKNRGWKWRWLAIGIFALLFAGAMGLASSEVGAQKISLTGLAIGFLFILFIIALPILVKPFTAVVGSKIAGLFLFFVGGRRAFGVTGEIARRNNVRNPRRTSRTALALMVGVSLIVFISVVVSSASSTFSKYFEENLASDLIIGDFATQGALTPERCAQIDQEIYLAGSTCFYFKSLEFVANSNDIGDLENAESRFITAARADQMTTIFKTEFEGDLENLGSNGVAVSSMRAERMDLELGDSIVLGGNIQSRVFTVKAILDEPILGDTGDFFIDIKALNEIQEQSPALGAMAVLETGVSIDQATTNLEELLVDTGIEIVDQKTFRDQQLSQITAVLNIFYGLLTLAIVIAAIGILNTMSLSVLERRRELGLMRAVGTLKSQVRGFIRFESVIVAVLGTTVGMVFGILGSFLFIQSLKDEGFDSFAIEPSTLIGILVLSAFIGALAGAWPAYRATKVDMLKAINSE